MLAPMSQPKRSPSRVVRPPRRKPAQAGDDGVRAVRGRARRARDLPTHADASGMNAGRAPEVGRSRPRYNAPQIPAATVKLQKRLAEEGLGSRRAMEDLIQAGEVSVNGKLARIGMRVGTDDRIVVRGEPIGNRARRMREGLPKVVLYHKPEGEIVTRQDPEGRQSVFDRASFLQRGRWVAVGRLDYNTCGLLLFTDSGELANQLSHPRFQMRRDYAVRVLGELSPEQMRLLRTGIALDDGMARCEMVESQGGEGSNRWYRVRVREGRNRLVRRLFQALGLTISRLMRTGFGPFDLPPRVKRGQWLRLDEDEVRRALAALNRASPAEVKARRRINAPPSVQPPAESRRAVEERPRRRPRWSQSK